MRPTAILTKELTTSQDIGIALFRDLFSGITSLLEQDVSKDSKEALCNVVRNKFKRNRHLQSHKKLHIEFEAGYEVSPKSLHTDVHDSQTTLR